MQEFSSLNGYAVKDATARAEIEGIKNGDYPLVDAEARDEISLLREDLESLEALYPSVSDWGDGLGVGEYTDDTALIQRALDSGKDIYFPNGEYNITGEGLYITNENQKITFGSDAWLIAKNITSDSVIKVLSMYNKLHGVKIRLENTAETVNAIRVGGSVEIDWTLPEQKKTGGGNVKMHDNEIFNFETTQLYSGCRLWYVKENNEEVYLTPALMRDLGLRLIIETKQISGGSTPVINFNSMTSKTGATKYDLTPETLVGHFGVSWNQDLILVPENLQYISFALIKPLVTVSNPGFSCQLTDVITTGTGLAGLQVYGLEARVSGGKFRGTKYGIKVDAADFYCDNVYCEQCTADGFRAQNGSIEAHHIHSYHNGNKGFHLTGVNFSNFYGLYADKNYSDGVYMANTSGEVNFFGGWGFYSGYNRADRAVYDWNFQNVRDVNLYGCRSNQGNDSKAGSYNVDATSRIYFDGCMATLEPSIKKGGIARFTKCQNILRKYNTPTKAYGGATVGAATIPANGMDMIRVLIDERLETEDHARVYDLVVQYREVESKLAGFARYYVFVDNHSANAQMDTLKENDVIEVIPGPVSWGETTAQCNFTVTSKTDKEIEVYATMTQVGSML